MQGKRFKFILAVLTLPLVAVYAGTGRAEDGFLFFIVILGFLGIILGILYLAEYIRDRIRKFLEKNGEELLP